MRIIFAGTPAFAAVALQTLIEQQHQIAAVYTQPDRPAGRGMKLQKSPVKRLALENALCVYQPATLKSAESVEQLSSWNADFMVVAAYGLILPKAVLALPKYGCINIHASLLPRWRGAAPIIRAIEAGDTESGISIMHMDEGLDTGDVFITARCPVVATETGLSLHDKLAKLGAQTCAEFLQSYTQHKTVALAQDQDRASYAKKVTKAEALIDWNHTATSIERKIRAFNSWPVAYTHWRDERLRLWQAHAVEKSHTHSTAGEIIEANKKGLDIATGKGILRLLQIQRPGGKPQPVSDLINALPIRKGERLA